jgi:hypothetical protein
MYRLHLVRPVKSMPPADAKRSAKVIALRVREEARRERLRHVSRPDRPDAA